MNWTPEAVQAELEYRYESLRPTGPRAPRHPRRWRRRTPSPEVPGQRRGDHDAL